MAMINQSIDYDTASLIAMELEIEIKKEISAASTEELIA
jgi:hypothetical protein